MTPLMRLAAVAVPAALVAGYVIGHTIGVRTERAARRRRQIRADRRLIRHEAARRHPAGSLLIDWDREWAQLVANYDTEAAE